MTLTEDRRQKTENKSVVPPVSRPLYKRAALRHIKPLSSVFCLLSSVVHAAEVARPAYTPPPPAVSSGNIAQIIFSLLLVLAAIVLVGWMLKRMNVAQQGSVKLLKVLGAVPIGQRERIVLVEIKDTWLVVGVGPGQIRTLHSLPKMEYSSPHLPHTQTQSSGTKFSSLLSSVLNHRKQKVTDK